MNVLGRSPSLVEATRRLTELRRQATPESPERDEASRRASAVIEGFSETYGYPNALLFDREGNTLFRYRPDIDPGPNLLSGDLRDSELAEVFDRVRTILQVDTQTDVGEWGNIPGVVPRLEGGVPLQRGIVGKTNAS